MPSFLFCYIKEDFKNLMFSLPKTCLPEKCFVCLQRDSDEMKLENVLDTIGVVKLQ